MKTITCSMLLLVAMIGLTAFAVAKDDKPRIRQIRNIITGTISDYTYTADGRLSSVKSSNGISSTYEYTTRAIYRRTINPRSNSTITDTFFLDDKGLTRELRTGAHPSAARGTTDQFEYTADGFQKLSRLGVSPTGAMNTFHYFYTDSNETGFSQNFNGESRHGKTFYVYYDRPNTIGNDNMGMSFQGHSSKDLVKEITAIWTAGDTSRTSFSYQFDEKGRVSAKTVYYRNKTQAGDSLAYSYY